MKIEEIILESNIEEGPRTRAAALAAMLGTGALGTGLGTIGAYNIDKTLNTPTNTTQTVTKPDEIGDLIKKLPSQPVIKSVASKEAEPFVPGDHAKTLVTTAKKMGITDKSDLAIFLAQCNVETGNWRRATENFNYTDPNVLQRTFSSRFADEKIAAEYIKRGPVAIANRALANKNGNGNEASGDGWRYRGRGFIHITGRELYAKAGRALHPTNPDIYLKNPDIISSNPEEGARVAAWYYQTFVGKKKTARQASLTVNPAGLKKDQRAALAKHYKDVMTKR